MANTAFDHASALTLPGSTTNNGLVRWSDTSAGSFGNITGITSDGSNLTLLTRGEIRFSDADSTHYIALESPATVSTSYTMALPAAVPSANDYLKVTSYSGGAGVLEWASVSADTNTTYLTSWVDSSANAILRLTPSSGSADDLTIVAGTNITLTPSGDNLTIDAAGGGIASVVADTTPQLGGNLDMQARLLVGNGGSTGIAISANGEVTMAAQPAFLARPGSTLSNVTGDSTDYTVVYNTEIFDQNADFDGASTFTAPITGRYLLGGTLFCSGIASNHVSGFCNIFTSNQTVRVRTMSVYAQASTGTDWAITWTLFADMDAADTSYVIFDVTGGSKVIDLEANADRRNAFYGVLIA